MKKILLGSTVAFAMSIAMIGVSHAADCNVGISMYTLAAPYFAAQQVAAEDQAKKAGCKVTVSDGQNDMAKQIADIEDMVSKGVKLIILNPRDPEGLVPAVDAATAAGVKIVILDSGISSKAHVVTQVRSSNDMNGFLVGQWLAQQTKGKALKILLLSGDKGNVVGMARRLGAIRGLAEGQLSSEGKTNFEIVGQGWGGWGDEGGLKAMEDLLTAHPDANVVLGENDSMVLGAMKALKAAGKTDVMVLAAADGQKEALALIKEGKYGATGLNDPDLVARTAVDIGLKALDGKLEVDFPKENLTEPAVITKENVDKYYRKDAVF